MEDLNWQVWLTGIAWQALLRGLNKDIEDQLSFPNLISNNDVKYNLLLKRVGHTYERCLHETNKHHHHDLKSKDKKNKMWRDNDGDKGYQGKKNFEIASDSK
jgi:hypothetical protein